MSLQKDIILGEIQGKNAAIHAYDKILWMIRSGYLTLFYGGWAIVLKALVEKGGDFGPQKDTMLLMFVITFSLAVGAYWVDKNYVRRKFRVICSLNKMYQCAFDIRNEESIDDEVMQELHEYIKVAGDADDHRYKTDGYSQAVVAENLIYVVSVVSLLAALLLIFK